MLSQVDKPVRRVSQAQIKFTDCHGGCGKKVAYRTNPKVSCEACKVERKRHSSRRAMERLRRRNGIAKVKGTTAACANCRCGFERTQYRAKYCALCASEVAMQRARELSRRKTATGESARYAREYYQKAQASNPKYRVNRTMKVLISRCIQGGKQGKSWQEFVPYTLDELMSHLERQFLPGMSWENRSKWHVDHIRPLASFCFSSPDDDDFQAAWALTNLRPLWGVDNMHKSAKRTHLL